MMPVRIQLSRRKGWKMPENTVKVDRSTKWGNPFVVADDRSRARCVELFHIMLSGYLCVSDTPSVEAQEAYRAMAKRDRAELLGRNLACWCPLCADHKAGRPAGDTCTACAPCHADILLTLLPAPRCEAVAP